MIELLVTIGIFTIMTGVVLSNYRSFDTSAKFANASEDIILALRQAQVYGVGVKGEASSFTMPYGVYFDTATPNQIKIFADVDDSKTFNTEDTLVDTVVWKSPITIAKITCGSDVCGSNVLNITFKRPNPDATIADSVQGGGYNAGQIVISNGLKYSTTTISKAGQISLQ